MLWIISGPSSIGKSTFIKSGKCSDLTGLPPETPVLKPKNRPGLDPRLLGGADCFVHYNILRPASLFAKREATSATSPEQFRSRSTQFTADPWWVEFSERAATKQAIVLVANLVSILKRAGARADYKIEYWQNLYTKLQLPQIYRAWFSELDRHHIPVLLVDATGTNYPRLDADAALGIIDRDS
jgi:hypothetical protein